MKNKSRKTSLIATAALSLLLGAQAIAVTAPYDKGWIIGSLCSDSSTPNSCIGQMCWDLYKDSSNECDWYSCIAGGRAQWNTTHPGQTPLPKVKPCMPSA
jgi:hypothetical protein